MIELRFIESLMSEKKKIRKEADALIERAVAIERIVNDEFDLFKNVMITIEMMLAFEAI
jgi:hypothetical protein